MTPGSALGPRRRIGPVASAPVILGCGSLGGIGSHPDGRGAGLGEAEAFAVLDAAAELGIDVFDTADGYAGGESERMVGAWLARRPERAVVVTTKVGMAPDTPSGRDLSPERIRSHAERSRRRLGVARLEMYMVHAPDPDTAIDVSLRAFDDLHRRGVIGSLGLCNVDLAQLEQWRAAAARLGCVPVSWVQNEFNLLRRRDAAGLIPYCAEHGLAYTAYSPLAGGVLSGRYVRGRPPPAGSRVSTLPDQYGHWLTDAFFAGLAEFARFAAALDASVPALALAWVMGHPGVAAPLVAPRTPAQFDSVVGAARLRLTDDQRAELAALFAGRGAQTS